MRAITARSSTRAGFPIVMVTGPSSSGKSYLVQRVLALKYEVSTFKLDRMYSRSLRAGGVPITRKDGRYSISNEARRLRDGTYEQDVADAVLSDLRDRIRRGLRRAHRLGVGAVLEGYTLGLRDEAETVLTTARDLDPEGAVVVRLSPTPTLETWNHNRRVRVRRTPIDVKDESLERYEKVFAPPELVPGIIDVRVREASDATPLLDGFLSRSPWAEHFTLGPAAGGGEVDVASRVSVMRPEDIVGRRVVDLHGGSGVLAMMLKDAGAEEVITIEPDGARHCKAQELQKVLAATTDLSVSCTVLHGDEAELRGVGAVDTLVVAGAGRGALARDEVLTAIAAVGPTAAYLEFGDLTGSPHAEIRLGEKMPDYRIDAKPAPGQPGVWRLLRHP